MYQNPFEEKKQLEIKIMHLEEQLHELEESIKPVIDCLTFYSKQHNGHYASEILKVITNGGH
jgi:hypothetical protein